MKLQLHHIEMCVENLNKTVEILERKFGFQVVGSRSTKECEQVIVQTSRTIFVVTCRAEYRRINNNHHREEDLILTSSEDTSGKEPWTTFCCDLNPMKNRTTIQQHIDSVFNIAIQVEDLHTCLKRVNEMKCKLVRDSTTVADEHGSVTYAIVRSCCGNVVHTLIEKTSYSGWFLPGFIRTTQSDPKDRNLVLPTHFDHVALACRVGQTNHIIKWYEDAFGMRRFITNKQDTTDEGLVIEGEVGMRLKVMEFWKCSETGVEPEMELDTTKEPLKIVVVESLANIRNIQVENFLEHHTGPGIQHIGLHTPNITETVAQLIKQDVQFRHPPATYYTEIGQLEAINSVGEDVDLLKEYGILLDSEADVLEKSSNQSRYLMQIFTYPIFNGDTFFLEIIQRKGARGFGVGNVTALARSINASNNANR